SSPPTNIAEAVPNVTTESTPIKYHRNLFIISAPSRANEPIGSVQCRCDSHRRPDLGCTGKIELHTSENAPTVCRILERPHHLASISHRRTYVIGDGRCGPVPVARVLKLICLKERRRCRDRNSLRKTQGLYFTRHPCLL